MEPSEIQETVVRAVAGISPTIAVTGPRYSGEGGAGRSETGCENDDSDSDSMASDGTPEEKLRDGLWVRI
eukprot:15439923-Alexandrium_andersonii.AAC.1